MRDLTGETLNALLSSHLNGVVKYPIKKSTYICVDKASKSQEIFFLITSETISHLVQAV